jgi:uncharacterized protein (TIGR03437 family)
MANNGPYFMPGRKLQAAAPVKLLFGLLLAAWLPAQDWVKDPDSRVTNGSVPYIYRLDDGNVRLLYCGQGGILSARSTDGLTFTQELGVRLMGQGGVGSPEMIVCDASIVRLADGRHRLYYKGADGPGGPGQGIHRVFSAISAEGLNYTREGLRLESAGTIDAGWASVPEVIRTFEGRYRMYYVTHNGPERNGIASAVSDDGLNFTREAGMRMSNWVDPAVIKLPSGQYWMLGLAGLPQPGAPAPIASAHSADGLNFVVDGEPLLRAGGPSETTGIFDPTVIDLGQGRFRVYYGALGPGNATNSATGPEPANAAFGRGALVSAADATMFEVAPDSLATIYAAGGLATADNPGGTTAQVNTRAATVLFARGDQVNIAVPAAVSGAEAQVMVTSASGHVTTALAKLSPVVPRLFSVAVDARTFAPGPFRLGAAPLYIALLGTGLRAAKEVTATLGGRAVPVLYAGAQPTVPGLDQINILVPAGFPLGGALQAHITAEGRESNRVTVLLEP